MDSPKKQADYVNTFGIVVIGLAGSLLVYVSFIGLQAFYEVGAAAKLEARQVEGLNDEFRSLQSEQQAELNAYRWIDQQKQTVTIPVDEAMKYVAEAARGSASTLVPAVGTHDVATVPAVAGRPPDNVQMPAPPAPSAPAPDSAGAEGDPDSADAADSGGDGEEPGSDTSGADAESDDS